MAKKIGDGKKSLVREMAAAAPERGAEYGEHEYFNSILQARTNAISHYTLISKEKGNSQYISCLDFGSMFTVSSCNIIEDICKHPNKDKVRLVLTTKEIEENVKNPSWKDTNRIYIIIKIVVGENYSVPSYRCSDEGYTCIIRTNIMNLEAVMLDLLIDIGVGYAVLSKPTFVSCRNFIMSQISREKLCFMMNSKDKYQINNDALTSTEGYCSFSSFFRTLNVEYDLIEIQRLWQDFFFSLTHEQIISIATAEELVPHLEKGQLNRRSFMRRFNETCRENGFYVCIQLIKSPIDMSNASTIKQAIKRAFKRKRLNSCVFININDYGSDYGLIKEIPQDMIRVCKFELIKE
ncbi:MAG: hypothetical protein LBN29_07860 [Mediterranea sp.]|jgi:hypothetical protein|nr:hypothetical protein [Mediterranea sp.]